jgi:hypothetical protein
MGLWLLFGALAFAFVFRRDEEIDPPPRDPLIEVARSLGGEELPGLTLSPPVSDPARRAAVQSVLGDRYTVNVPSWVSQLELAPRSGALDDLIMQAVRARDVVSDVDAEWVVRRTARHVWALYEPASSGWDQLGTEQRAALVERGVEALRSGNPSRLAVPISAALRAVGGSPPESLASQIAQDFTEGLKLLPELGNDYVRLLQEGAPLPPPARLTAAYNPARAGRIGEDVAREITALLGFYNPERVAELQSAAGLEPTGLYDGQCAGAVATLAGLEPPAPIHDPKVVIPYEAPV